MALEHFVKIWQAVGLFVFCQLRSGLYVHGLKCFDCNTSADPSCRNGPPTTTADYCNLCTKIYQEVYSESEAYVVRKCLREYELKAKGWTTNDLKIGCNYVQIDRSVTRWVCMCNNKDLCNQGTPVTRPQSALYWACAVGLLFVMAAF